MDPITDYLTHDHERLDGLLARSDHAAERLDLDAFHAFREGLLRHIAMEEKVLLPLAKQHRGGVALPVARRLSADHSALAMLLVPNPTRQIIAEIRRRLIAHNPLEEGPTGMYCVVAELLTKQEQSDVRSQLVAFPQPPVAAYSDNPRVLSRIRELML